MATNYRRLREAAHEAKNREDWGDDGDNFHDNATPDVVLGLLDDREKLKVARKQIAQLKKEAARVKELEKLLLVAEEKQNVTPLSNMFDRLWERFDEATQSNAEQMKNILVDTLSALESTENHRGILWQSNAQIINTRDHYKMLWRAALMDSSKEMLNTPYANMLNPLPGGFELDEARKLVADLTTAHISKAVTSERMKSADRFRDLAWIHGLLVTAKHFVSSTVERYERKQPLELENAGIDWEEAEAVADELQTYIEVLIEDPTKDNAVGLIRSVMEHVKK